MEQVTWDYWIKNFGDDSHYVSSLRRPEDEPHAGFNADSPLEVLLQVAGTVDSQTGSICFSVAADERNIIYIKRFPPEGGDAGFFAQRVAPKFETIQLSTSERVFAEEAHRATVERFLPTHPHGALLLQIYNGKKRPAEYRKLIIPETKK